MTTLRVVGHKLLIKPTEFKKVSDGGIILEFAENEQMKKSGRVEGTVLQVGSACWKNPALGYGDLTWKPWCKEGDRIQYVRYAGEAIVNPDDPKTEYVIINDTDVQIVMEDSE